MSVRVRRQGTAGEGFYISLAANQRNAMRMSVLIFVSRRRRSSWRRSMASFDETRRHKIDWRLFWMQRGGGEHAFIFSSFWVYNDEVCVTED